VSGDPEAFLRAHADWLFEPALGACIVGSHALAAACAHAGIPGPEPADLDLAWGLDPAAGNTLLQQRGVCIATTDGSVARGTLAMKLHGQRIEITTFRGGNPSAPVAERIAADLAARDMTIGALALELATGRVHDPMDGLRDWRERRIVPVGDPALRVREHPVRWLRWYRKAHQLGFVLDRRVRKLDLPVAVLDQVPREAIALELRAGLEKCPSPGRLFLELHEAGLLQQVAPELALQFDGRPAGPQRHHPEVGQALHLVLALEWTIDRCRDLDPRERYAVLLAVLCHDLGKGYTPRHELPSHPGHEGRGRPHIERLLDRLPGLADPKARSLSLCVCELHLEARKLRQLRPGTLAGLYDRWFRPRDFPVDLFALAVGAESGGRLGLVEDGDRVREQVAADVHLLRRCGESVDAEALRKRHPDDLEAFRRALHEARSRAIAAGMLRGPAPDDPED
jgi:tRNA nucleotidyltransferase/poly(A) polymerase